MATGAVFVALVAIGAWAYQRFAEDARDDTRALLLSTARALSREFSQHVTERKADAVLVAVKTEARRLASGRLSPADEASLQAELLPKFRLTAEAYGFHNLVLYDTAFRQVTSLTADEVSPATRAVIATAMRERRPQAIPLHIGAEGIAEYGAVAPVFASEAPDAPVIGAVMIALWASDWLYPTLSSSGVVGLPFEIVLAQLEGDTMVVAHSTRMPTDVPALSMRYPITGSDSALALTAALRRPQLAYARGLDFVGTEVEVAAASVVGTPWAVSVKVPIAESESAIRLVRSALAVIGVLLLGVLYSIVAILQRRARHESGLAARESANRALRMVQTSMDGVIVLDTQGRFLEVNEIVSEMTGYSVEELLALRLHDIKVTDGGDREISATIERIKSGATRRYLSQWRHKDGRIIDVDVSASFLRTDRSELIYAFIRDVTDTLRRRRSLERLNRLYQFVNHASEGSFVARSAEEAYESICRAAVDDAGFRVAWIGLVDPAAGVVRPVRCAGTPEHTLDQLVVTLDPALATSQGATSMAVRDRRTCESKDLRSDPAAVLLQRSMPDILLRGEIASPVVTDGAVSAVIVLYTDDPDPLDAEAVTLVGEVARLLGLVVQSLAAAERVAQSEERFRQLFDRSPLPHYVIEERTGRIARVNRALTALFGYDHADLPDTTTVLERLYPDPTYRAMLGESLNRQLAELRPDNPVIRSADLSVRCKDGRELFAQAFITRAGDELIVSWVDVTELRSNQLLLNEAQQMAKIGSWDIDQRSGEVHFSPELYRILELATDVPASAEAYFSRVVPVEIATLKQLYQRMRVEQEAMVLEHRLQFPDGRTKTVVLRVLTHFSTEGEPLRSVGSVQDVTAQADTRRELERYRDHLEDIVAARTEALAKANATLQTTDKRLKAMLAMSQRASVLDEREIYQLGIDEAVRLTGSDAGYLRRIADDQEGIEFELWSTGASEESKAVLGAHRPDGHLPLARHVSVPVLESDKVRLLLGVGNKPGEYDQFDVQELQLIGHDIWTIVSRRRAELALAQAYDAVRASEERFAFAMEAASEGIWDWDFKSGRIEASAACYTMLGYRLNEFPLTSEKLRELMHPDDRARVAREGAAQLAALGGFALEFRLRARDGTWRWILSHAKITVRGAQGEPTRAVGTHTDLTARKTAEEELRNAKEQADAASRAKSSFLAVMSHEIRTPLNGVLGMAEVLAQSTLPPREADAVRVIRTSANNLLGLIDDILDFSKIEAGRLDIEFADTSIPEILEDVRSGLDPVAVRRRVELSLFLAPSVPHVVRSDAMRLRQILYNLVGNAIKFSGGRSDLVGRVAIRVTVATAEPLALRFTVQDNGIGMAPDTIARLFSSFMQAEASTTRRFGGTGLGLAICKRLTDLFGGTIDVASELGKGSTFTVTIPLEASATQPDRDLPDVAGLHCVLVRDPKDPQDMEDVAEYLTHAGAHVAFSPTVDAAIATADGLPQPVVVIERTPDGNDVVGPVTPDDRIRHLRITHGQRRAARGLAPNSVALDRQFLGEQSFLRAVAIAAGRASPEVFLDLPEVPLVEPDLRPQSIAEARARGKLILVAEDDEINQKVILRQLELLGFTGEVAPNGKEALAMWRRGGYALLLTDLHMPEMDGYALTQAIRAEERGHGRFPIVALTANALRGESAQARAIGMDDYLTKPIPLRTLKKALNHWLEAGEGVSAVDPVTGESARRPRPLALETLRDLVGNDPAIVDGFLREFEDSAGKLASELHAAYALDDLVRIGSLAHRLKSSSRSVGALALGDRCAEIEVAVKRAHTNDVRAAIDDFDAELERVQQELSQLLHPA